MSTNPSTQAAAWRRLAMWLVVSVGGALALLHLGESNLDPKATGQTVWQPWPKGSLAADLMDVPAGVAYLQKEKPAYIGVGNSMLYTRLGKSAESMSKLTGERFVLLHRAGSSSAIWYLMLKNVVVASGVKPKAVFLFVRDDELTASLTDSDSNGSSFLQSLRGNEEPELDRLLGLSGGQRSRGAVQAVVDWFDFGAWRYESSKRLVDLALDVGGMGMPKKAQRFVLSERFGVEHLRGDLRADKAAGGATLTGEGGDDFAGTPLDEMLITAERAALRLVIVRVKRRPNEAGVVPDDPPGMPLYAKKLQAVIERRGGVFLDETNDPSIRLSDYLDGDHIRPERQDWYRDYFWKRIAPLLP